MHIIIKSILRCFGQFQQCVSEATASVTKREVLLYNGRLLALLFALSSSELELKSLFKSKSKAGSDLRDCVPSHPRSICPLRNKASFRRSGRRPLRSTDAKQPWKPSLEATSLGRFPYIPGPRPAINRSPDVENIYRVSTEEELHNLKHQHKNCSTDEDCYRCTSEARQILEHVSVKVWPRIPSEHNSQDNSKRAAQTLLFSQVDSLTAWCLVIVQHTVCHLRPDTISTCWFSFKNIDVLPSSVGNLIQLIFNHQESILLIPLRSRFLAPLML